MQWIAPPEKDTATTSLEREHAEYTLMHAPERLSPDKPFEAFDAECELAQRE